MPGTELPILILLSQANTNIPRQCFTYKFCGRNNLIYKGKKVGSIDFIGLAQGPAQAKKQQWSANLEISVLDVYVESFWCSHAVDKFILPIYSNTLFQNARLLTFTLSEVS